ncbi:hypothetical protein AB0B56_35170 [Streptosporangium canum]|uniref:hypothetical protein n=1 Tax=Streptosporangium canum TaxID=324952 RepID=UPI00342D115E
MHGEELQARPFKGEKLTYFPTKESLVLRGVGISTFGAGLILNATHGDRLKDVASYGVVRMLDQKCWAPKEVFHTMAVRYARD